MGLRLQHLAPGTRRPLKAESVWFRSWSKRAISYQTRPRRKGRLNGSLDLHICKRTGRRGHVPWIAQAKRGSRAACGDPTGSTLGDSIGAGQWRWPFPLATVVLFVGVADVLR